MGTKDSNEVEVLAISEVLKTISLYLQDKLIVGTDSTNSLMWVYSSVRVHGDFIFH